MKNHNRKLYRMAQTALIASLYTVLTLTVAPAAFGPVQFRVSEALTLLPLFSPVGIWGVTLGCLFSNLIGYFLGLNPIGLIDAAAGTTATFLAALLTYWIGRLPLQAVREKNRRRVRMLLAPVPAVLFNALIIGLELALVFGGNAGVSFAAVYAVNAAAVAAGEIGVCYTLGLLLCGALYHNDLYKKCLPDYSSASAAG